MPGRFRRQRHILEEALEDVCTLNSACLDRLVPRLLSEMIWLFRMEQYGNIIHMKKTLHIDEKLLKEARTVSRAATDTETVRLGLEALIRHAAHERLRALRGTDATARDTPRRREKPARKRRGA